MNRSLVALRLRDVPAALWDAERAIALLSPGGGAGGGAAEDIVVVASSTSPAPADGGVHVAGELVDAPLSKAHYRRAAALLARAEAAMACEAASPRRPWDAGRAAADVAGAAADAATAARLVGCADDGGVGALRRAIAHARQRLAGLVRDADAEVRRGFAGALLARGRGRAPDGGAREAGRARGSARPSTVAAAAVDDASVDPIPALEAVEWLPRLVVDAAAAATRGRGAE